MAKYELIEYDTWGNEEEGFEVNNVYRTGIIYEISDAETDEEIIKRMCTEEKLFPSGISIGQYNTATWLKPEAQDQVHIIDESDFGIEFALENGCLLGRLELMEV